MMTFLSPDDHAHNMKHGADYDRAHGHSAYRDHGALDGRSCGLLDPSQRRELAHPVFCR